MKPVSLNQLLFHTKCDTLSFYRPPLEQVPDGCEEFISDMYSQLMLQKKIELAQVLEKNRSQVKKIMKNQVSKSHGFFFSQHLVGYVILDYLLEEPFCVIGTSFHVKPILEELFTNPEFMVVNISLYDVKVYRGDFQHLEIIQHYEFDQLPRNLTDIPPTRVYAPQYLGLLPYKTLLALKNIAGKIQDMTQYHSIPVIITGLAEVKNIFMRYFTQSTGVISGGHEDFYEQTCMQVLEGCRPLRPLVLDYYSAELKERLKKMIKSRRLITDLTEIIRATGEGRIIHLVLPTEAKLWGSLDFSDGTYEIHKRVKKNSSVDILNELAEQVIKQGGRIQFLRPHFLPQDSYVLGIMKG